jgi:hypothetical protein
MQIESSKRNPLKFLYNEKNALNGHSVDSYDYAIQLLQDQTDYNIIKAYAWLSLASDEIDMRKEATRLLRQIVFILNQRGLFLEAFEIERDYRTKFSSDALREHIKNSWNPLNIFLYRMLIVIEILGRI